MKPNLLLLTIKPQVGAALSSLSSQGIRDSQTTSKEREMLLKMVTAMNPEDLCDLNGTTPGIKIPYYSGIFIFLPASTIYSIGGVVSDPCP